MASGAFVSSRITNLVLMLGLRETTKSYKMLPYMEANPSVKTFRHAMALDERRIKFSPVHYTHARAQAEDSARGDALAAEAAGTQVRGERIFAPTTTREVWFVGCHSSALCLFLLDVHAC